MMNIQEIFNSQNGKINIPSGEFEGPVVINKSCTLNGNNATIWTKNSPVIIVESDNVIIKNLRVELTKDNSQNTAIVLKNKNIAFENVEVFGEIEFFNKTATKNNIPRVLDLGEFRSDTENIFIGDINLSDNAEIVNNIYGLKISPQKLVAGKNNIELKIAPLREDTVIYGSFLIKTSMGILRRIYVSGNATKNAAIFNEKITANNTKNSLTNNNINTNPNNPSKNKKFDTSKAKQITKGERIKINENAQNFIAFNSETLTDKVDQYVFLLDENNKVKNDNDLIFFGNPNNNGIVLKEERNLTGMGLYLKKVPQTVKKIALVFAIYDEGVVKNLNFYSIKNPEILFYENDEIKYFFPLNLNLEKAVNAVEFYRHKGIWKANFVGAGFNEGIRRICEMYGVNVE